MNLLPFLHRPDPSTATTVLDRPADRDEIAALQANLRDEHALTESLAAQIIHLRARLFRAELEAARLRSHNEAQCWVCYPAGGAR